MEGGKKSVNSELWHACAGPRISLPSLGSLVVYFPQGHSEQVAASTLKEVDGHIPNYPNLQSQLVCQLHNITLHADVDTDEVFAQMTLQPVSDQEKDLYLPPDIGTPNRQLTEFFCKNLTASDTSTHGGFSIPRRAAEKVFPPLDFTKQPPAQELQARDLHDHVWTFRHIYRGQPKRHLLTTGWSVFVSAKRLVAGDSVLFIRDDKGQLLLGIRRANTRHQSVLPSSLLSSDSMHIGVLAAAAHAAATSSRFQVFYNPRTSPSEFVIPWSKYRKAVHFTQVSVGMRFRMVFETEESNVRRYMGTITGIGDLDATRWPGSKWRNLEVGWDESSAGERPRRVSPWEIEPLSEPFFICSPSFPFRPKRPYQQGDECDMDENMKQYLSILRPENGNGRDLATSNVSGESWLYFQRPESVKIENVYDYATFSSSSLQDFRTTDASKAVQRQLSQQGQFMAPQQQDPHVSWPHTNGHQQQAIHPQPLASPPPLQSLIIPHTTFTQTTSSQITSSQSTAPQTSLPPSSYQTTPLSIPQPSMHVTTAQPTLSHPSANNSYSHSQPQPQVQPQLPQTPQVQPRQVLPQIQPKLLHTTHLLPSQITQQILPQGHHQATSTATQITETPSTHLSQVLQSRNQSMTRPIMKFPESEPQYGENTSSFHGQSRTMLQRGSSNAVVISSKVEDDGQITDPNVVKVNPSMVPLPQLPQPSQQSQQSQQLQPPQPPQLPQLSQPQPQPPFQHIPQIESHIGNWFHFPRENTQCESPMLSNIQIGQSDTSSSTVTSCSHSLAPESFDNSLILPTTTTSFAPRFNNINKDVQCQRAVNDTVMGSFSSPSGSFTPGTPDGSRMSAGMISNAVLDEGLMQRLSHVPVPPPVRTFTKVHKSGSVGRSIDLSRMTNYDELRRELARLFNIEGQLEDPQRSYWQLVFVDTDGDILLVGDDPWDEFVSCVRAIKILSTAQVLQMNQEGLEQLTNALPMLQTSSSSEDFQMWKGLQ